MPEDRVNLLGLSPNELKQASISNDHPYEIVRRQSTQTASRTSLHIHQHSEPATPSASSGNTTLDKDSRKIEFAGPLLSSSLSPDFSFTFRSPFFGMAREQEPARPPLGPARGNAAPPSHPASREDEPKQLHVPELPKPYHHDQASKPVQFGAPSPLGPQRQQNVYRPSPPMPSSNISVPRQPPADQYSSLFIPKGNRPELHKPKNSTNPFHQLKDKVEHKVQDFGGRQNGWSRPYSPSTTSKLYADIQHGAASSVRRSLRGAQATHMAAQSYSASDVLFWSQHESLLPAKAFQLHRPHKD